MRRPRYFYLLSYFLITFTLCFGSVAHSESVELSGVLKEAMGDSLEVQKAKAGVDLAYWKKNESFQGFLPRLEGAVNYLGMKKYMFVDMNFGGGPVSVPQILPNTIYTLTGTIPLFDGFAGLNRYWAGQSNEQGAKEALSWTEFSTERQVKLFYYKSLAAKALREVAEQNTKVLQGHLKDVQELKKAGVATGFEVLRVEVQVSEAQSELLNTEDNLEMSRYKLGEVLGKEKETRDLAGDLPVVKVTDLKSIENLKVDDRGDLKALRSKTDALKYMDTAVGRYWVPRVSAYGQYQYYNNLTEGFDDSDKFREAYQVGLSLTWNLFDGLASVAKSKQSSAEYLQIEKSYQQAKIKSAQDVEFWKRKLIFFQSVYEARVRDVQRSKEALRLASEGRRVGSRTLSDVLDAELDLFRSEAGQVNAQIGAIEAVLNLELATGQSIYSFN